MLAFHPPPLSTFTVMMSTDGTRLESLLLYSQDVGHRGIAISALLCQEWPEFKAKIVGGGIHFPTALEVDKAKIFNL